jgi:hypothetical protein
MSSPLRRGLHANAAGFRLPSHPTPPNLDNYAKPQTGLVIVLSILCVTVAPGRPVVQYVQLY